MKSTPPSPEPPRSVGRIPFQVTTLAAAVAWIIDVAAAQRLAVNVRLANAYNVALAEQHPDYAALMSDSGVNFPDGMPVVWVMNQGSPAGRAGRVRGPSFFEYTLAEGRRANIRHFLLGSRPETLEALRDKIDVAFPGAIIAGSYSPPFAPVSDKFVEECAAAVKATDADLVWVSLGTPKQDYVGENLAKRLQMTTVNVGAAFDFTAGTVEAPPEWVQRSGFEWLHRLMTEPARLWKRYLFGNIRFAAAVCAQRLRALKSGL